MSRRKRRTKLPPGQKRLEGSWLEWLELNHARGCAPDELFDILRSNGYADDDIRGHLSVLSRAPSRRHVDVRVEGADRTRTRTRTYEALASCAITRRTDGVTRVDTELAQVYVVDQFMGAEACRRLVEIIDQHLRPSTVTDAYTPTDYRTSSTCDLGTIRDPLIDEIDARIAKTLGLDPSYAEPMQAQRYQVGEQFKEHTDYFEPGSPEFEEHAATRGQRSWTFMVYLNDTPAGGGTRFLRLGRTFMPRAGQAVVWNSLHRDGRPNFDTLHWGMPVEEGRKYIITKWFRDRGAGSKLA